MIIMHTRNNEFRMGQYVCVICKFNGKDDDDNTLDRKIEMEMAKKPHSAHPLNVKWILHIFAFGFHAFDIFGGPEIHDAIVDVCASLYTHRFCRISRICRWQRAAQR